MTTSKSELIATLNRLALITPPLTLQDFKEMREQRDPLTLTEKEMTNN